MTAEEWKRRYEKEREKVARLKGHLARAEIELEKWRRGETVSPEDQVTLRLDAIDAELPSSASMNSLASVQLTQPPILPSIAPALSVGTLDQTYIVSPAVVSSDWEKERAGLYEQLDEKDDEINNQSQAIEKLKIQMIEQDEIINQLKKENDDLQSRISGLEIENESQKDEVKEVLKALEELAMNFDQKQQEAESRTKENETLSLELDKKVANLKHTMDELETLKDNMNNQRKRILDMMITLLKDLGEIGVIIGGSVASDFKKPSLENLDNAEEDFTMARLYVSKMKGEIKLLTQRCLQLDEQKCDTDRTYEQKVKELEECRLVIIQNEAKMKSQQEYIKEIEAKKRKLEDEIDSINEELTRIKAQETVLKQTNQSDQTSDLVNKALKEQLESHIEQLKKQVKDLRDDNDKQQKKVHELNDENQNMKLAYEKSQHDFEKLKKEENEVSAKLQDLLSQQAMREQAKQDLKGLEETVAKELQSLHNLRKLFVQDLQNRLKKVNENFDKKAQKQPENEEDELSGNIAQKQKIAFLENNLEQLTKVHKQLVRDNADLRCELPKLEKRLKATMERVKSLEVALKEAKEGAMKDRKRYQNEVERIKEAVRQRNLMRKGNVPNIVKPIRAGQQPNSTVPSANVIKVKEDSN